MGTPVSAPGPMSGAQDLMAAGQPGAGQDAARAALEQTAQQVRELGNMATQIGQSNPLIQGEMQQVLAILKQAIIKAAQAAPMQTASGMTVPGGGGV